MAFILLPHILLGHTFYRVPLKIEKDLPVCTEKDCKDHSGSDKDFYLPFYDSNLYLKYIKQKYLFLETFFKYV